METLGFNTEHPRVHVQSLSLRLCGLGQGFPGGTVVKKPPAGAGDAGDTGSIPESGRSPRGGDGNPSSILAWEIAWTEEPDGLQSMGSQRQI